MIFTFSPKYRICLKWEKLFNWPKWHLIKNFQDCSHPIQSQGCLFDIVAPLWKLSEWNTRQFLDFDQSWRFWFFVNPFSESFGIITNNSFSMKINFLNLLLPVHPNDSHVTSSRPTIPCHVWSTFWSRDDVIINSSISIMWSIRKASFWDGTHFRKFRQIWFPKENIILNHFESFWPILNPFR